MSDSNLFRNIKANTCFLEFCREFFIDFLEQLFCFLDSYILPLAFRFS